MTWEHIAVLAAAVVLVGVGTSVIAWRDRRRIEARFDRQHPEPELISWSESVGFHPVEVFAALRRQARDEAWQKRMLADLDSSPILAELVSRPSPLAIEPAPTRELEGATR